MPREILHNPATQAALDEERARLTTPDLAECLVHLDPRAVHIARGLGIGIMDAEDMWIAAIGEDVTGTV